MIFLNSLNSFFTYLSKNKDWIFSGIGIFILSGIALVFRHLIFGSRKGVTEKITNESLNNEEDKSNQWNVIKPSNSKYKQVSRIFNSIPVGVQTFSFKYSLHGHAHPLSLKGKSVRAEIQFSCKVSNVRKAMFEANEYGLNVLQPQFLIQARNILEKYSLKYLREKRPEVAVDIINHLSNRFDDLGFQLLSVTIGALEEENNINEVS